MKKIDWIKWSASAEILGAIAIIVTLIYLAVQTRYVADQTRELRVQTEQNTALLQAAARQASLDTELRVIDRTIDFPLLYNGPLIELSDADYAEADLIRIISWQLEVFRTRETYWLQYRAGVLDPETWESYRSVLIDQIQNSERARKVWGIHADTFDPGFAEEMSSYLSD